MSEDEEYEIFCRLIREENFQRLGDGDLISVVTYSNKTVASLKKAIYQEIPGRFRDVASVLQLWKLEPAMESKDERFKDAIEKGATKLDPVDTLDQYWQNAAKLETRRIHLLVVVPQTKVEPSTVRRKRGADNDVPSIRRTFVNAQNNYVSRVQSSESSASAGAKLPNFPTIQNTVPVLNGRPATNHGWPIGLYHPSFDEFKEHLAANDEIPSETKAAVRIFVDAITNFFTTEETRKVVMRPLLINLLGSPFIEVSAPRVKSDGILVESVGPGNAYVGMLEEKNEIGTGGSDPYNQVSLSFQKYWADPAQERWRQICYCPSILIAIAGPWLCVSGGVYTEKAIVQPLTEYVWLGCDGLDTNRLLFLARFFHALKKTLSSLREYYKSLAIQFSNPIDVGPCGFPYIVEYNEESFSYVEKLAHLDPNKLVFKAEHRKTGEALVVKFTSVYNEFAHRILAECKLAPTLRHVSSRTYGGRLMIVMDYVEGEHPSDALTNGQYAKLKSAVGLLHDHNLVFGDLRRLNVLLVGDDIQLIDFDWCDVAGRGRYPLNLNENRATNWATGVGPDAIMEKEHDLEMAEKLCERPVSRPVDPNIHSDEIMVTLNASGLDSMSALEQRFAEI